MPALRRRAYLLLAAATTALGLASRRYAPELPGWVGAYLGDALWALLVFWLVSLGWPQQPARRRALAAGSFALLIELSQLWQAPWLRALRHTTPGHLVLGQGFRWSDLASYAAGIAVGYGLDVCTSRPAAKRLPGNGEPLTKVSTDHQGCS